MARFSKCRQHPADPRNNGHHIKGYEKNLSRASDFPFQKKQFSVSKKVKFRFGSVSLLATLNSMKSQYIERKCGERTVKMAQLVR